MRQLAAAHGEAGWHPQTLPLLVDAIEIVASLVLLAGRRTGRRSGWLPWAALAAGTTASLAADVAAAATDLSGRVIAGWPAFALLIAVKLLSGLPERRHDARPAADDRPACRPDPVRPAPDAGDAPRPARPAAGSGTAAREGRLVMSPLPARTWCRVPMTATAENGSWIPRLRLV